MKGLFFEDGNPGAANSVDVHRDIVSSLSISRLMNCCEDNFLNVSDTVSVFTNELSLGLFYEVALNTKGKSSFLRDRSFGLPSFDISEDFYKDDVLAKDVVAWMKTPEFDFIKSLEDIASLKNVCFCVGLLPFSFQDRNDFLLYKDNRSRVNQKSCYYLFLQQRDFVSGVMPCSYKGIFDFCDCDVQETEGV